MSIKALSQMGSSTQAFQSDKSIVEIVGTEEISVREQGAVDYDKYSNINKKDLRETFKNVVIKNDTEGKHAKKFNNYVKLFKEKAREKGIGILMVGNHGTGKTYYSNCIWNELHKSNKVYKTTFSKYVRDVQDKFEEEKYLNIVKNADLVILDDLGNEYFKDDEKGSWKKEILFNLFQTIYENEISLIITTNLNEAKMKEFLEVKGSNKVYDRILERCAAFPFNWESRRPKLYENELKELFADD